MKKISLLVAMAFATIMLSACSSTPKTTIPPTPDPTPATAAKTNPIDPPAVQPPVAQPSTAPVAKTVTAPAPAADPAPVKAPVKPKTVPAPTTKLVNIQSFTFMPKVLTLKKGDSVKWVNKDSAPHTVTSETFKSDQMNTNNFFTHTFTKAGNYNYHCIIHPSMTGSVIVNP